MLLMIGAHACDAFLDDSWKHNWIWYGLDITFGFVGPAFLFLSGTALALALSPSHDTDRSTHSTRYRQARRLAFVLSIAYWLQIPVLSLRQLIWEHRPHELARLFDSNILHVVAIGGLICVALDGIRNARRSRTIVAILGCAIVAVTPEISQSLGASRIWLPLRSFVLPPPDSTFPLFPNLAYLFAGFSSAACIVRAAPGRSVAIVVAGAMFMVISFAIDSAMNTSTGATDFWRDGYQQFAFRLGGVVTGLGAVSLLALKVRSTRMLEHIGRHSFGIYVLHLVVIYGSPVTMGARYWFESAMNRSLDPATVLLIVTVVATIVSLAVTFWSRLGQRSPSLARVAVICWWLIFAGLFVLIP